MARLAEVLARNPFSRVNDRPVVLLGNQKSGTTAVAALVAEMTDSSVTLDLIREVVDPSFDRLKRGTMTFDEFVRRNRFDFSREIVKEPQLTVFYEELASYFPRAKFGLVVRDPRDNIRSILDRLGVSGREPDRAATLRHRNDRGWRLVLNGEWLGVAANGPLEYLAHRWNLCADVYLEHPENVALVRYEDFVVDKMSVAASLASSFGLDVGRTALADGAGERQYQPAGRNRGRSPLTFFGPENLATIERICHTRMEKLGYTTVDQDSH